MESVSVASGISKVDAYVQCLSLVTQSRNFLSESERDDRIRPHA